MNILMQGPLIHYLLGAGLVIMIILMFVIYKLDSKEEERKKVKE